MLVSSSGADPGREALGSGDPPFRIYIFYRRLLIIAQ